MSAIIHKYKGKRCYIRRGQNPEAFNITQLLKHLWRQMTAKFITNDEVKDYISDRDFQKVIFKNARQRPPHPLIQSYYITLWSHIDLHYAMNYILSGFCTAFDEAAIVVLLKQLTVCARSNKFFVGIIQAIWHQLFYHHDVKSAVLDYDTRNVASYSLMSLAVYESNFDIFLRLFNESMNADQQITLATYNCIVRRLGRIPREKFNHQHMAAIDTVWSKVTPSFAYMNKWDRQKWVREMLQICQKFELFELALKVKAFGRVSQ